MATTREEARVKDAGTRPVRRDAGGRAEVGFDEPQLRAWIDGILNRHPAVGLAVGIVRHDGVVTLRGEVE